LRDASSPSRTLCVVASQTQSEQPLADRSVLVIGAGALGVACISHLARAGTGRLGIVDPKPELAEVVASRLGAADDAVLAEPYPARFEAANAAAIVAGADVVVDCTSDPDVHHAASDACISQAVPLVVAGITDGRAWLTAITRDSGCWSCVEEHVGEGPGRAPEALEGAIGSLAALEAIKLIEGVGAPVAGRVLVLDGAAGTSQELAAPRREGCPSCARARSEAVA
jgi:molybdopterin/thiamine biosynthesis adenylyltransferase